MPVITIEDLAEETYRALKARAAQNGRTTETEILNILEDALRPIVSIKIGSELAAFGRRFLLPDLDIPRDSAPIEPATFE